MNQYFLSKEKNDTVDEGETKVSTVNAAFNECIKHHQMILEFTMLLEDFFRWFLFPKLFFTGKSEVLFFVSKFVETRKFL